MKSKDGTKLKR